MIDGDDERLAFVRQRLADGQRVEGARFAAAMANRARTDEEQRDDAEMLVELVGILADALIAARDKHGARGRPKKYPNERALLDLFMGPEYDRWSTAGNVAEGRKVQPDDVAGLLWWAYIGPHWMARHSIGNATKTPEEICRFLAEVLADPAHKYHKHYTDLAQRVAVAVLEQGGLHTVERQQFKAEVRRRLASEWQALGATVSVVERSLTKHRRRKKKQPR